VPTYQYACTACDEQLEVVQRFTDDPLTECPACQGRLRKVFSAVGVVFKGSGFYRNDSRSGSKAASGSAETATTEKATTEKAAASSSSSASDSSSKPAAATTSSSSTSRAESAA
jgi:putative FmdB family regulatory protein